MRSRMFAVAVFVLAACGCGSGGYSSPMSGPSTPSSSSAITVSIMGQRNGQSFSPNPAPIAQGSLVAWQNSDNTVHRVVMNDGSFDSGNLATGATSSHVFDKAGTVTYHCNIHSSMKGTIQVS